VCAGESIQTINFTVSPQGATNYWSNDNLAIGLQKKLTVFGNDYPTVDGSCVRDFIHVVDLANAHVQAIDFLNSHKDGCNEAINIGTGKGTSVLEIIHLFEKISNQKLNWEFGPRRDGDVIEIFANASKAKELLNWETKIPLEEGIQKICMGYISNT
jgi:UDP-glucose 4-epimerase